MRKTTIAFAALSLACSVAWADLVRVNVARVHQDLYRTVEGAYVHTVGCDEFPIGEDAVLRYDNEPSDVLMFQDGAVCQVIEVYK